MKNALKWFAVVVALFLCVVTALAAKPIMDEAAVVEMPEDKAPATMPQPATVCEPAELMQVYSGICGANVTWSLDTSTGVLTISGTGAMDDWLNYNRVPWNSYRFQITSVSIASGVTAIGRYAFYNCSSLTSVTIPNSVTYIGLEAFSECSSLASVVIPDSVTRVGGSVFQGCTHLASVTIPSSITNIPSCTFDSCSNLTSITIPDSVTAIGDSAFWGCSSLTSVNIPANVTSIGHSAFDGCSSMVSFSVSEDNAYYTALDGVLFDKEKTTLIHYPLQKPVASYAIPSSVTTINHWAFWGCTTLTAVTIPDSVTSIGSVAFCHCPNLASVTIGRGVRSIEGVWTFAFCPSMKEFIVNPENTAYCSDKDGVLFTKDKSELVYYPAGRKWPCYNVPAETKSFSDMAFCQCADLVSLYIPKATANFDAGTVYRCPDLTLCVYRDSPADTYAKENNLNVFCLDDAQVKGITAYSLPPLVQKGLETDLDGLYMVVDVGVPLQLDDYELTSETKPGGVETVTVTALGHSYSFDIQHTETVMDFGEVDIPEGALAMAALYKDGKMLCLREVEVVDGRVRAVVPSADFQIMDRAVLFRLDGDSFAPVGGVIEYSDG